MLIISVILIAAFSGGSENGFNTSASNFVLPRLGGPGKVSLKEFSGRPLIVNFFASWCTECASELPVFAQDAILLKKQINIVEVNSLETGNGLNFAQQFNILSSVSAVASDVGGSQGNGLYQSLGGTGSMPLTAFYSKTGVLLTTHIGAFDASTLASEINQLYGLAVPTGVT